MVDGTASLRHECRRPGERLGDQVCEHMVHFDSCLCFQHPRNQFALEPIVGDLAEVVESSQNFARVTPGQEKACDAKIGKFANVKDDVTDQLGCGRTLLGGVLAHEEGGH